MTHNITIDLETLIDEYGEETVRQALNDAKTMRNFYTPRIINEICAQVAAQMS